TTAAMFAAAGAPVYDSDAAVHRLYAPGGAAVAPIDAAFPGVVENGAVDRARLSERVLGDPEALRALEAITHPLVFQDRAAFFAQAAGRGAPVAVVDVPLLLETGGERLVHAVAVVSAPEHVQRERVLARPGMSEAKLEAILARQMPDVEKRARADFVIDTGSGLDAARAQVAWVLAELADPAWRSRHPDRLDASGEPRH
ncbi:MAG: dephospho-CoA kinase, partial [Pseudomonadota bacterium]|nr:dephospho-CoA kinase [Pseudomonadota bacterium]